MPWLNRIFDGRKLVIHGTSRQRIPGNWKLMMENIKDPYHPGLLHTWFVTFGLWRADQSSRMVMDAEGRHAVMISQRNAGGEESGRASCRERVCQYVSISVVAVSLKNKNTTY